MVVGEGVNSDGGGGGGDDGDIDAKWCVVKGTVVSWVRESVVWGRTRTVFAVVLN